MIYRENGNNENRFKKFCLEYVWAICGIILAITTIIFTYQFFKRENEKIKRSNIEYRAIEFAGQRNYYFDGCDSKNSCQFRLKDNSSTIVKAFFDKEGLLLKVQY